MDARSAARAGRAAPRSVGSLVAGRYRLREHLADGGMGSVWCARDEVLHRDVALKFLRDDLADDDVVRARFRAEARTVASLSHPAIAQLHDYVEHDDTDPPEVFLAMELVRGRTLARVLRDDPRPGTRFVRHVLGQCAEALAAAHRRGVVHRDVTPRNLLVGDDGRVKLADFGIARAMEAAALTREGHTAGTAPYMAPEQVRGDQVGPRCDVYAFGVVAYEMLAGRRPFPGVRRGEPVPPLPAGVPHDLRRLVEDCLRLDARDRPPDGAGLLARLGIDRSVPLPPTVLLPLFAADVATEVMPVDASAAPPVAETALAPIAVAGTRDVRRAERSRGWWWAAVAASLVALLAAAVAAARVGAPTAPVAPEVTGVTDVTAVVSVPAVPPSTPVDPTPDTVAPDTVAPDTVAPDDGADPGRAPDRPEKPEKPHRRDPPGRSGG